jgi:hypothetical protein
VAFASAGISRLLSGQPRVEADTRSKGLGLALVAKDLAASAHLVLLRRLNRRYRVDVGIE